MRDFLEKRPMLSGAVIASVISVIALYAERALFVICMAFIGLIFIMIYKNVKGELIFSAICILAVAVSSVFVMAEIKQTEDYDNLLCSGEFVVTDTPTDHGTFYSATLETVSADALDKGERLTVTYNKGEMYFSQRIKAQVSVSSLKNNEFKSSWYSDKVFLSGYVKEFSPSSQNEMVLSLVDMVRQYIKLKIFEFYKPSEAATMMALITGDKSYFSDSFYSNVKSAGVAHVMVVSGMHLSVIVEMFLYLTNKLFYNRYLKALIIFIVTVTVMAVCGFTMSILRAGITYILLAVALILNRENTPVNTLGCAVTIILISNPLAIFSVAFLLSVLSTFAILAVALPVTEYLSEKEIIKSKALLSVVSTVLISLCALVFTAPVAVYVFGYISNVSLVTNLLIGLATSTALILCILAFVVTFAESLLFSVSQIIVTYINWVINYFGSLSFATTNLPKYSAFIFAAVIIIVLWILLACKKRQDVLKLKEIRIKKYKERGKRFRWQ